MNIGQVVRKKGIDSTNYGKRVIHNARSILLRLQYEGLGLAQGMKMPRRFKLNGRTVGKRLLLDGRPCSAAQDGRGTR